MAYDRYAPFFSLHLFSKIFGIRIIATQLRCVALGVGGRSHSVNLRILETEIGDSRKPLVNMTNHPVRFLDRANNIIVAQPCSMIPEAELNDPIYGYLDGVRLRRPAFSPMPETRELIGRIKKTYPGAVLVGSVIPAQAYPGLIWGLRPTIHTLPSGEKVRLMRLDEFNTYEGRCYSCGHELEARTAVQIC